MNSGSRITDVVQVADGFRQLLSRPHDAEHFFAGDCLNTYLNPKP